MVDYRIAGSLGERIQAVRKSRGIRSARALADLIDNGSVSEAILQNIETGRLTNVSIGQLLNIAFALKVPLSFLLAPLGDPARVIDLPNLSSGLAAMSATEFDAWLSGLNSGSYRPTTAAEMSERNELAAYRDLQTLQRERTRLEALAQADRESAEPGDGSKPWVSKNERLDQVAREVIEITIYLESAGWPDLEHHRLIQDRR